MSNGGVHFKVCVSYVGYIEDTTRYNQSTTQRKGHAGYIEDTQFRTVDKSPRLAGMGQSGRWVQPL